MRKKLGKLYSFNMRHWLYIALLLALAALRVGIALCQRVYLLPQQSGIDDMLMIRAAQSITEGNWLGAYGGMAIAKNMGYALWLALLHALRLPVLPASAFLWVAACGFALWALRPLFKGNALRLGVFAFLAFQPVSFAFFTQRVYRDGIFPAFCLLFFAGFIGLVLRLTQNKRAGCLASGLVAGVGFGAAWLTREDGIVLLAFALCASLFLLLFILIGKTGPHKLFKALCTLVPFAVLGLAVALFSFINLQHYGVFMVNDLNSGAFPKAYGAMVAVSRAIDGDTTGTPVTQAALSQLYAQVPSLAPLQNSLASGPAYNGFASQQTGQFGGSFYFAVRVAAEYEGLTPTAQDAQHYWQLVQTEIVKAVEEGRLPSAKAGASTIPYFTSALTAPLVQEAGRGFWEVLTFQNCSPRPAFSQGEEQSIAQVSSYLHSPVQQGYAEGTSLPYYNIAQRVCFALCDILIWLYRVVVWPLLALALVFTGKVLAAGILQWKREKRPSLSFATGVVALGLLLSVLLRVGVAAYMEVAAFYIGTYIMYYAAALPPLLLFLLLPLAFYAHGKTAKPKQEEFAILQ